MLGTCPNDGCGFPAGHESLHPCGRPLGWSEESRAGPFDDKPEIARHAEVFDAHPAVARTKAGLLHAIQEAFEVIRDHGAELGMVVLNGDEAAHYLRLKAASKRALEAQNAHATAGKDFREAIEAMCKAMAPA